MARGSARLIDLTLPPPPRQHGFPTCILEERNLLSGTLPFTAAVWHFHHDSMAGTYIDFPGHIEETDDGLDADTYPLDKLFRVDAAVIHLERKTGSGRISADELAAACPEAGRPGAVIVNALGRLRWDEIEERSVYLGADAVRWMISRGFHLLLSDVYESNSDPQHVFNLLLEGRVSTICCPDRLHVLDQPMVKLTALPLRFAKANQLPCRVIAEVPSPE